MEYLPYSITRTWHTQLGVFWIATAWLAAGLYVAPLISKHEPKYQSIGVNFLFFSLLLIVVGSFVGEWLAINGFIENLNVNFWFGHQGYEYVDLGRFWQIYLFVGLLLWAFLLLRALLPAFRDKGLRSLVSLVVLATLSIGLLYAAGFMWGKNTNIAIMEYWRWWVVHLWVEGLFEVFATAIISVLFVRMGLVRIGRGDYHGNFCHHRVPGWRCAGNFASFILERNPYLHHGYRSYFFCPRSCPFNGDWF